MKTYSAATAPWFEEETDFHEIEKIRGNLLAAWRSASADIEAKLTGNGSTETVISDLFDVGRVILLLSAHEGDADVSALLSVCMQDLLALRQNPRSR